MSGKIFKLERTRRGEDELTFLLIGKPRQGKSATGNSILNSYIFKTFANRLSEKREVTCGVGQFCGYSMKVVDALCLENDDEGKTKGTHDTSQSATAIFDKFPGRFDAFLFIIKFGNEFTAGDKMAFDELKGSLGDNFMDHVTVVVTCGDQYVAAMKYERPGGISFNLWCSKQRGPLQQLYRDCQGRFVLFNNWEINKDKKMEQVKEVIQLSLRQRTCFDPVIIDRRAESDTKIDTLTPKLHKDNKLMTMNLERQVQPKEEKTKLTFLMMGKTGNGKSATGNTILNRRQAFKTSANVTSETKKVRNSYAEFDQFVLCVVDGPGLEDTSMSDAEDKISTAKHMDIALAMCDGGVHAFLLIIKFGNRFTKKDLESLQSLKTIFGENFMSYVIVVMTGGDSFETELAQNKEIKSFIDWCVTQTGPFKELYEDCQQRCVLINNFGTDENKKAQVQQIVQLAHGLHKHSGHYTSQLFIAAKFQRERMILECRAPQLKSEIQEKVSLLTAEMENLNGNLSDGDKSKMRIRIRELKDEIIVHDKGYGVLDDLMKLMARVEENLNDVEELQKLSRDLDKIRKAKIIWGVVGSVCTVAAVGVAVVAPPVGVVAGACAASTIGSLVGLSKIETIKKERKSELEIKRHLQKTDVEKRKLDK